MVRIVLPKMATNEDLAILQQIVSADKLQNVYLYINLSDYCVENENIDVWFIKSRFRSIRKP